MAVGSQLTTCTVVLHDDAVSKEHVLCDPSLVLPGKAAYLVAANAKRLCFLSKEPSRNRDEVSVHASVARQFGFENRTKANIEIVDDVEAAIATHVEFFLRDQHLSRADMWHLESQIDASVLYQGQTLSYLGSHVATVESVYISGKQVDSACVLHPRTKLIFRSGSARYILLVQISKEMLECWSNGDLLYERLLNGYLPELLHRWEHLKVRHQVTVVLFGRRLPALEYLDSEDTQQLSKQSEDFFQVVAADLPSHDGRQLLQILKKALNSPNLPHDVCLAADGNTLEAINIAAAEFVQAKVDPPLASTGSAIIVITAGSGLFQAQHRLLRQTTRLLMGNSVGVDIVSTAPKPLHPVPLFQYAREGVTEYALPHWADISYWKSEDDRDTSHWLLPAPQEALLDIALPHLDLNGLSADGERDDLLETHDQKLFGDVETNHDSHTPIMKTSFVSTNDKIEVKARADLLRSTANDCEVQRTAQLDASRKVLEWPINHHPESLTGLPKPRKQAATPHPLLQMGRNVSIGAKSAALNSGVASTSISMQRGQHGRDSSSGSEQSIKENPSNLAKQIRASLRRKPSQASFAPSHVSDNTPPSQPIQIRTSQDRKEEDPASIVEKAVMQQSGSNGLDKTISLSATPKASDKLPRSATQIEEHHHDIVCPWLTLLNPCNPHKDNMRVASEYRQWQNVFPKAVGPDTFRWDSMTTPAVLPLLRESRISLTDLETHFEKKVRRLVATMESAREAMRQMIALRLSYGFQVVPTRKLRDTQKATESIERILLSLGDYYHDIRCLSDMEVQVSEYWQELPSTGSSGVHPTTTSQYSARIRPALGQQAHPKDLSLAEGGDEIHWSILDDQCANPGVSHDSGAKSKMRLVLIPVPLALNEAPRQLSDEERRIDGIQRLTQLWQRNRYFSEEDQRHQASLAKPKDPGLADRDPDPLAIEYQTRDPSAVVSEGPATGDAAATLFPKSETYHTSKFDTGKLVKHMQEPPPAGIELKDRRWLTRFHLKCFRGDEMTNWLLRAFRDLRTREDAVALGNQLMDKDMFTHVRGKHEFRDGNYFYQIKSAHRTTLYPDTAGFFARGLGHSVPSTPIMEMKQSPSIRALHSDSDSSGRGSPMPSMTQVDGREKQAILLSQSLQYNVDPTKKSKQLEIVTLHYGMHCSRPSYVSANIP